MAWLARSHPELVGAYRSCTGGAPICRQSYREVLRERAAPLIARHGLTGDHRLVSGGAGRAARRGAEPQPTLCSDRAAASPRLFCMAERPRDGHRSAHGIGDVAMRMSSEGEHDDSRLGAWGAGDRRGVGSSRRAADRTGRSRTSAGSRRPVSARPVPDGFAATMNGYRDWLIAELETIGRPVDLVGHDWGGGHVLNVAMTRPDLIRTWVSDVPGVFDPEYVWHDLAQQWQTPDVGEQSSPRSSGCRWPTGPTSSPAQAWARSSVRVALGIDDVMGQSILTLYRSAAQPAVGQGGRESRGRRRAARACAAADRRRRSSAPTSSGGVPLPAPEPASRCSTGSVTGG